MLVNEALKPRTNAKASKVVVTKADGTVEVRPAYNKIELQKIANGKKPRRRKKAKQTKKRWWITKNRKGSLVVCGETDYVRHGMRVKVHHEQTNTLEVRTVIDLGEPFQRNKRTLVYGYFKPFKEHK
jgi:hypothetical protein